MNWIIDDMIYTKRKFKSFNEARLYLRHMGIEPPKYYRLGKKRYLAYVHLTSGTYNLLLYKEQKHLIIKNETCRRKEEER